MEKTQSVAKRSSLDRDLSWAYQEIAYEAFFVIWMSTNIAAEFGMRCFPDWAGNRVDPQNGTSHGLSYIEDLLHDDSDPCFWSRVVSHWKLLDSDICQNSSSPFSTQRPGATRTKIACVGALATLSSTTMLFISFLALLFVNRRWRLPEIRGPVPYLDKLYAWIDGEDADDEGDQDQETLDAADHKRAETNVEDHAATDAGNPDTVSMDVKLRVSHENRSSGKQQCAGLCSLDESIWSGCRKILKNLLSAVVYIICTVLFALAVIAACFLGVMMWEIIMVCPVVVSAVMIVRTITAVCGEETAFPCYAILVCVSAIYCSGRIWGLWMNETYYSTARNIYRKIRGSKIVEDQGEPRELLEGMVHCKGVKGVMEWICGCMIAWMAIRPLFCRQYSDCDFSSQWNTVAWFHRCYPSTNNTIQDWWLFDSMLSYWMDVSDFFGNASTLSALNLPAVSPEAKTVGMVWTAWTLVLAVVNAWPFYLLLLVGFTAIGCALVTGGWDVYWYYRTKRERTSSSNSYLTTSYSVCIRDEILDLLDEPTILQAVNGFRYFLASYRAMYMWWVLPSLAPHYFLPEKYQLPGVLLIITCSTVWNYYLTVPSLWKMRRIRAYNYGLHREMRPCLYAQKNENTTSGVYVVATFSPESGALSSSLVA